MGDEVYTATPLSVAQVEPALPREGLAGIAAAVDILSGRLAAQLSDPEALLLPRAEWPAATPRARTQLTAASEWIPLARLLHQRRLVSWIPEE